MEEIVLNVDSSVINATNRKLKAVWSMESQQDVRSQHNIIAEQALTEELMKELTAEIDEEILKDLRSWTKPIKPKKYRSIDDDWEAQKIS